MADHTWYAILSVLVTIACCLLGVLIVSLRIWKKGIEKVHEDLWDRVNHHYHNGGGNVVIPTTPARK